MKRTYVTVLAMTAALVTATAGLSEAATKQAPDTSTLQRDADALLGQGAPGALVELDTPAGKTQVRSGFGDVGAQTQVPWDAEFRIGSFTKTFVSATLLQLVGEGKLSLEDTVDRWLPGVVSGNGNDGAEITVRQLLQHTSGLADYVADLPYLFNQKGFEQNRFTTVTPEAAVALAVKHAPHFAPGTDWEYSNTNYALAGMIIGRVTGHRWQDEVQQRIIRPLGLSHTYTPGTFPFVPGPHAVGYQRFPDDVTSPDPAFGPAIDATVQNPSWGGAAGEIISTTEDGNRFLRALVGGKVLKPAQLAEMQKTVPATRFNGPWPGARYGLGLMWIPNSCGGSWSHGGDIPGFKTRNGVTADGTRSVIVSINTDSLIPKPGAPVVTKDPTVDLIDHALCGTP